MSQFLGHVGNRSGDLHTPTAKEVGDLEDVRSDSGVRGGNGQEIGIGDMEEIVKTVCVEHSPPLTPEVGHFPPLTPPSGHDHPLCPITVNDPPSSRVNGAVRPRFSVHSSHNFNVQYNNTAKM